MKKAATANDTITVSKDQLKRLQANRGKVNTDNGSVFVKCVGAPVKPDDASQWRIALHYAPKNPDLKYDSFSLRSVLEGSSVNKETKPVAPAIPAKVVEKVDKPESEKPEKK